MAMSKTKKGLIVTAIVVIVGASAFFFLRKKRTKAEMVSFIILSPKTVIGSNGKTYTDNFNAYMTFDDEFINNWYNALHGDAATFVVRDKTINISTGREYVK